MKISSGDFFLGDGTWLGRVSEVDIKLALVTPADPEWPEVVLEDVLDAEEIG